MLFNASIVSQALSQNISTLTPALFQPAYPAAFVVVQHVHPSNLMVYWLGRLFSAGT
jgi:hypothetical protein